MLCLILLGVHTLSWCVYFASVLIVSTVSQGCAPTSLAPFSLLSPTTSAQDKRTRQAHKTNARDKRTRQAHKIAQAARARQAHKTSAQDKRTRQAHKITQAHKTSAQDKLDKRTRRQAAQAHVRTPPGAHRAKEAGHRAAVPDRSKIKGKIQGKRETT